MKYFIILIFTIFFSLLHQSSSQTLVINDSLVVMKAIDKYSIKPISDIKELYEYRGIRITPLTKSGMYLDSLAKIFSGHEIEYVEIDCNSFDSISVFLDLFKENKIKMLIIENYNYIDTNLSSLKFYKELEYFKISYSLINKFPMEICELNRIEQIDLYYTFIQEIPKEINKLKGLKILELIDNKIKTMPIFSEDMKKFEKLFISGEYFLDFRDVINSVSYLSNFNKLAFSDCHLQEIPIEISKLTKLKALNFEKNKITGIPIEISMLTSLEQLDLSDNYLTEIPEWLKNIKSLENFFHSGNFFLKENNLYQYIKSKQKYK